MSAQSDIVARKKLLVKKRAKLAKKQGKKTSKSSAPEGPLSWDMFRELSPGSTAISKAGLRSLHDSLMSTEDRCYTIRLGYDLALTTDGAGLLASVISNIPSNGQNWSSYAAVFDECRVLGMTVRFEPLWATGGSTTLFWAPIASVIDRSDATALTGYGLAERYQSHHKAPGQKKWAQTVVMSDTNEANFQSTASVSATAWVKLYSSGNSISTTLGRLDVSYYVQFRGLGIN